MDPHNYGPGDYGPANFGAAGGPGSGAYGPAYEPGLGDYGPAYGPGLGDYGPGSGQMLPGPGSLDPGSLSIGPAAGHAGRGPRGYTRPDARILEDVCEKLTIDPAIDAREVSVEVEDGVVRTSGTVESRQMKRMVEDIALTVWGVKDVDDQIQIALADQE